MGRLAHDALQRLATAAWRRTNKRSEAELTFFVDTYPGTAETTEASQTRARLLAASEAANNRSREEPSGTDRRSAGRATWISISLAALLVLCAVALLLAVPALRPPLPPEALAPAAEPTTEPAKAAVDPDPVTRPRPQAKPPSKSAAEPPAQTASPAPAPARPPAEEGEEGTVQRRPAKSAAEPPAQVTPPAATTIPAKPSRPLPKLYSKPSVEPPAQVTPPETKIPAKPPAPKLYPRPSGEGQEG
jgi:hypothetical protein